MAIMSGLGSPSLEDYGLEEMASDGECAEMFLDTCALADLVAAGDSFRPSWFSAGRAGVRAGAPRGDGRICDTVAPSGAERCHSPSLPPHLSLWSVA